MNVELLKDAIEIIGGIPDNQFDLDMWQQNGFAKNAEEITCNTIACAGGWLALHPKFQALGLKPGLGGIPLYVRGDGWFNILFGMYGLSRFFDIPYEDAEELFEDRTEKEDKKYPNESDRQIWIRRATRLLKKYQHTQ